jgi:outer membrane immunogenic protein
MMLYHQLRGLLVAGIATTAFCGAPALAADMPVKAPAPFSWDGLYVGVHAGYGWGDYKFTEVAGLVPANARPSGWLGGAQIGYNVQFAPHWMLGGEFDLSWTDIRGSAFFPGTALMPIGKVDSLGTARTRLGYIVDRTMLYATGGLAWAHTKSQEFAGAALIRDFDQSHFGWVIGGGLEYALDQHWSAKVEYLYADLGRSHDNLIAAGGGDIGQDLKISTVKAGINYRFGAPAVYAADMPVKAYAQADPWSGSYLGLHGGYGWSDLEYQFGPVLRVFPDPHNFFGGFQTGYNWRFAPNWLFGLETDSSFGNLSRSDDTTFPGIFTKGKIDSFGTARARLGYIADRSLWYVTGGAAVAQVKIDFNAPAAALMIERDSLHAGWTVGGGIEYAIDPLWSAKIEYLYADLGRNQDRVTPFATDLTMNTVKLGLNYHGPVLERLFGGR